MNKLIHIVLMTVFAFTPLFVSSAQGFRDRGPASKRLDQLRKMKMIEALDLDEEQAVRLFARENEHRKEQKELNEKRISGVNALHDMLDDEASDEELVKATKNIHTISKQLMENKHTFMLGLDDILSVSQIAKMVVFEEQFSKEVRKILESMRDRKRPGGAGRRRGR